MAAMAHPQAADVTAWEVRGGQEGRYCIQRGTEREGDLEEAASGISDYGVACVVEAALNLRDGTVE